MKRAPSNVDPRTGRIRPREDMVAAAEREYGRGIVTSLPGANVFVNGQQLGTFESFTAERKATKKAVKAVLRGAHELATKFSIAPTAALDAMLHFTAEPKRYREGTVTAPDGRELAARIYGDGSVLVEDLIPGTDCSVFFLKDSAASASPDTCEATKALAKAEEVEPR